MHSHCNFILTWMNFKENENDWSVSIDDVQIFFKTKKNWNVL